MIIRNSLLANGASAAVRCYWGSLLRTIAPVWKTPLRARLSPGEVGNWLATRMASSQSCASTPDGGFLDSSSNRTISRGPSVHRARATRRARL